VIYAGFIYTEEDWPTFALEFESSEGLETALRQLRDDTGDWSVIYSGKGRFHLVNRFWLKVVISSVDFDELQIKIQVYLDKAVFHGKRTIGD